LIELSPGQKQALVIDQEATSSKEINQNEVQLYFNPDFSAFS
jgi:hypothetical protein